MHGNRHDTGTRFRLFPRPPFVHPGRPPEVVSITTPPGMVGPGPSDDRLYLIDPIGKRRPYGINPGPYGTPHLDLPPLRGPNRHPALPRLDGAVCPSHPLPPPPTTTQSFVCVHA